MEYPVEFTKWVLARLAQSHSPIIRRSRISSRVLDASGHGDPSSAIQINISSPSAASAYGFTVVSSGRYADTFEIAIETLRPALLTELIAASEELGRLFSCQAQIDDRSCTGSLIDVRYHTKSESMSEWRKASDPAPNQDLYTFPIAFRFAFELSIKEREALAA